MKFEHEVGDRVVIEVTGRVIVRQENERGQKYLVQPDDNRAAVIHAPAEHVFAEDDGSEPTEANVVRFPRPPLPASLAQYVDVANEEVA
jgi:hypothetical protein